MKLAEALALRGEVQRRIEQLRARAERNARHQEGETPSEDAQALVAEADRALDELEKLMRQINKTNSETALAGGTLTDALARRDVLKLRHRLVTSVADAGSGSQDIFRQLRSELRDVMAVPVADYRRWAQDIAKELRLLDSEIQQANWMTELIED